MEVRHLYASSVLALMLFIDPWALAQVNPVWSSIDLRVAQADRVVIGHIAEMGEAIGSAKRNERQQPIILAVDETVKGGPMSRLPLIISRDTWRQLDHGKVLCVVCVEHTHRLLVTINRKQDHPSSVTDLDGVTVVDVTADLRLLSTGTEVVQAARDEARRFPAVLDDKTYYAWGPSAAFMVGTPFHNTTVYVPLDDRQEGLARQILASQSVPTRVVPPRTNDRASAVSVLGFFSSSENVTLLRSLLNDPQIEHAVVGKLDYPVRIAAFNVLKRWGVDVSEPVMTIKIQEPWNGQIPEGHSGKSGNP